MKNSIEITELDNSLIGIIKKIKRKVLIDNIYKMEQLHDYVDGSTRIYLKNGESILVYEDKSRIHKLMFS